MGDEGHPGQVAETDGLHGPVDLKNQPNDAGRKKRMRTSNALLTT